MTIDYQIYDAGCRTSVDLNSNEKRQSCAIRDYLGFVLADWYNICVAKIDDRSGQFDLHRCDIGSVRFDQPLLGD